ncbi:MAG: transposase [Actinophytocola sp.]|uniref:transposase n=1 Tax=Actinophytocola sp. TaxID=1872138 RepID=UPI0013278ED8|nr:transposase [Actinophytocola sp.]
MARGDLSDAERAILGPLLPAVKDGRDGRRGGRRRVVVGIPWRMRTGAPWRDLPERYGPWKTWAEPGGIAGSPPSSWWQPRHTLAERHRRNQGRARWLVSNGVLGRVIWVVLW